MSGGSFDYLCFKDNPGADENMPGMIAELDYLAKAGVRFAREAADESRRIRRQARAHLNDTESPIVEVWRTVEWYVSRDYGRDQVVAALENYGAESKARAAVATRFADLEVAELQQLLVAVGLAYRCKVIAGGPGNLLPALSDELGRALDTRLAAEEV